MFKVGSFVTISPQYDTFDIIFYIEDEHFLKIPFSWNIGK